MNLLGILLVLRARYKIALGVAFFTIVAVILGSQLLTKQYIAETTVMVDVRSPDPVAAVLLPPIMQPGTLNTQIEIIKSNRVARKVVVALGLDANPTVKQMWQDATKGKGKLDDWIVALLQKNLTITPARDSSVISISYRGVDPGFVAVVANAYAQAYIEASVELKVEPARQYSRWFGDQAKVLRENVEKSQAKLSEFQQKNQIVATDEAMDNELARLNDLSARLTAAQGETRDAQSKRSASGVADTLPEVMQNSVVSGLRADIIKREAQLKEIRGNLGEKHPQYLRMEMELAELKARLVEETSHVATGYSTSTTVGKTRESDLRSSIDAQRSKLLKVRKQRDEIAVLLRDVDTAKRAHEAVTNRYNQTQLESQATQTNVSVLTPAIEPLEPSFPKPLLQMTLMAIALGMVLAGGAAFLVEMLDRRIRTVTDLRQMLQLPVLGVLEQRRRTSNRLLSWHRPAALLTR